VPAGNSGVALLWEIIVKVVLVVLFLFRNTVLNEPPPVPARPLFRHGAWEMVGNVSASPGPIRNLTVDVFDNYFGDPEAQ